MITRRRDNERRRFVDQWDTTGGGNNVAQRGKTRYRIVYFFFSPESPCISHTYIVMAYRTGVRFTRHCVPSELIKTIPGEGVSRAGWGEFRAGGPRRPNVPPACSGGTLRRGPRGSARTTRPYGVTELRSYGAAELRNPFADGDMCERGSQPEPLRYHGPSVPETDPGVILNRQVRHFLKRIPPPSLSKNNIDFCQVQ